MGDNCALIIGSAPCVYDDMVGAPDWPLIVCNAMGIRLLGKIEAWCSVHGANLEGRMRKRFSLGGDEDYRAFGIFGAHLGPATDPRMTRVYRSPEEPYRGSTGLFAVKVALRMLKFDKVVLCGIPLDGNETIQDDRIDIHRGIRDKYQNHIPLYQKYQQDWIDAEDELIGRVTSMSGWTRLHFGGPE